nr:hypothetical protein [Rhodocyclaceae bacterium]
RSWNTYRVSEENKVTQIEEVRGGLLLVVACAMALGIAAMWRLRRSANGPRADTFGGSASSRR